MAEYYTERGAAPSQWIGRGAEMLGFDTTKGVNAADYSAVLARRDPRHPEVFLTGRRPSKNAVCATDFILMPPKSYSVLAAYDPRLDRIWAESVVHIARAMERDATVSTQAGAERGKGGRACLRKTGVAVMAAFHHEQSRENDLHKHTHLQFMSISFDEATGRWYALQNEFLYENQTRYKEMLRAHLAKRVTDECGYELTGNALDWEFACVSEELKQSISSASLRMQGAKEIPEEQLQAAIAKALRQSRALKGSGLKVVMRDLGGNGAAYDIGPVKDALTGENFMGLPPDVRDLVAATRKKLEATMGKGVDARARALADEIREGMIQSAAARALASQGVPVKLGAKGEIEAIAGVPAPFANSEKLPLDVRQMLDEQVRLASNEIVFTEQDLSPAQRARIRNAIARASRPNKTATTKAEMTEKMEAAVQAHGLTSHLERVHAAVAASVSRQGQGNAKTERTAIADLNRDTQVKDAMPDLHSPKTRTVVAPEPDHVMSKGPQAAPAEGRSVENDLGATRETASSSEPAKARAVAPAVHGRAPKAFATRTHESIEEAVNRSANTVLARSSVVPLHTVVQQVLSTSPAGSFTTEDVHAVVAQHPKLRLVDGGHHGTLLTSDEVVETENEVTRLLAEGKNRFAPLELPTKGAHKDYDAITAKLNLDEYQAAAVAGVVSSKNAVSIIRGLPGSGKSTTLRVLDKALAANDVTLHAYASTVEASRGADGLAKHFAKADTVKSLLVGKSKCTLGPNDLVVVDEAGLLGMDDMKELLEMRAHRGFRLVLVGDTAQNAPIARGDGMRHCERASGLEIFTLENIYRQRPVDLRSAAKSFAVRDTARGLQQLDKMGAVVHGLDYEAVADDYIASREKGETMVIAHTNREIEEGINPRIRARLASRGEIDLSKETDYRSLESRFWGEGQRATAGLYRKGDIIKFHRQSRMNDNSRAVKASEWIVEYADDTAVLVRDRNSPGYVLRPMMLSNAKDFGVFDEVERRFAPGDRVRTTNTERDEAAGKALPNGHRDRIKEIKDGKIHLEGGAVVNASGGSLTHNYARTVYSQQGPEYAHVIAAISRSAGRSSATIEALNVLATRASETLRVHAEDYADLERYAANKTSTRLTATEALEIEERVVTASREQDVLERGASIALHEQAVPAWVPNRELEQGRDRLSA